MSGGGGCIFCGRSPQTETHIFRKAWIERLTSAGEKPFEMSHSTGALTGEAREGSWPADVFGMAPGAACARCNSGWMDQTDRAGERIVEPMIVGQKATVRRYIDQRAVARWISQVAILMDQTQVVHVVPPEIPRRFYEDQSPLPGMVIWLARTATEWEVAGWQRSWMLSTGPDVPVAPGPNMSLFTFRIVNLVVQALVPLEDEIRGLVLPLALSRGPNMKFLKQLWPSNYTPVSWPPSVGIRPDDLELFAKSFEPPDADLGKWSEPFVLRYPL